MTRTDGSVLAGDLTRISEGVDGTAVEPLAGVVAALPPVDASWRAVVVDGATETLLLLGPTDPKPVPVGPAVPGFIFELRDPSRLVFLRSGSQAAATIFSQAPARTLGPVPLGDFPLPNVGANVGAPTV